jgi:hypothetical protein
MIDKTSRAKSPLYYSTNVLSWQGAIFHPCFDNHPGEFPAGAFQIWGNIQKAATNTHVARVTSILSLSKDAVLGQKGRFRDPSRFDRLSVTTLGKSAPKEKRTLPSLLLVGSDDPVYNTIMSDFPQRPRRFDGANRDTK